MSEDDSAQSDLLEAVLVHCWETMLRQRPIGVDDNFFALGGHSLLAMRVAGRLRQSLGVTIDYATVLENLTIAALARELRGRDVPAAELDRASRAYLSEHGLTA
jgi:aryl carrier-like protein